jgi:hypothetical protein
MNRFFSVVVFATILAQTSLAQTTSFQISSFDKTPEAFQYLLLPNSNISKNDTANEKILDLVEPWLLDSVIENKKQHHKVFMVGWFIHAFGGYNWRAVSMHKQKFIGTVVHHGRSGRIEYSEYDVNFDLKFHLDKYLDKVCTSCDLQKKFHRQDIRKSHHTDYSKEPFVRDKGNINPAFYGIEAELTPPYAFIPQLNYLFYPTIPGGGGLKEHPNFGTSNPSMGFYGVNCLDCNHNCHPEIHPYEMTWWLKATDDDNSLDKTWLFGIFHESSNRMKKWSINPMTGTVKIPFAFDTKNLSAPGQIKVDHLVFNRFKNEEMKKIETPEKYLTSKENNQAINFLDCDTSVLRCSLSFNQVLMTDALKYWFSSVNYDKQNKILSGYLNIATSVDDLYTTKITFHSDHGK